MFHKFKKGKSYEVGGDGEGWTIDSPFYWYRHTTDWHITSGLNTSGSPASSEKSIYFRVKLKAGVAYSLGTYGDFDGKCWLYDESGVELTSNDDGSADVNGEYYSDAIGYTPSADGIFIFRAGAYSDGQGDIRVCCYPQPEIEEIPESTMVYETSSGFNAMGKPISYDIASECGINYIPIPAKGLIFYAPCETDANVKIGTQFTTSGEFTTQVVDDIKCLKFNVPYTQEVDTSVFIKNQVTLSALYYKKQTNTSGIVLGYGTDSIYCYFALEEYYGQFYINHAKARLGTGYNMEDDTWYHLAVTLDNTTIKAYVNGELVSTFTRDMNLHDGYLGLGGWAYGNGSDSPNGYITKCRIYNRPLTEKEIQFLYKEYKGA